MAETLTVTGLCKSYGEPPRRRFIFAGVALTLSPGQSAAIVGPSGIGKSTFLNLLGALDKPDAGAIRLGPVEVTSLTGKSLALYRNRQVGFVFQDHHLLPQCTALENVLLPTLARRDGEALDDWGRALLQKVGLPGREDEFPATLSGGERQRIAVARALIHRPPLLLCDEPTGNLDPATAEQLVRLLLDLVAAHGLILVMVTHNLELSRALSLKLTLRGGKLVPA